MSVREAGTESVLRRLNRVLVNLQLLNGLTHVLKALVVWSILAAFIRSRFGWDAVHLIAAVSLIIFAARQWPTRRLALRRLEEIRPDSDYRFTTFDECGRTPPSAETAAWVSLRIQTARLLASPIPYLSLPGFAFSFRSFAAAVSFLLVWSVYAPETDHAVTHLPPILRIKLPSEPVRAGSDVRVQIFSEGRMSMPRLQVLPADAAGGLPADIEAAIIPLVPSLGGLYEATLNRVTYSIRLTAVADLPGGKLVSSPEARVQVVRPPILAFVSALISPPTYTKLPPEEIRGFGKRLSVLPGTEFTVRLESDLPLSSASARFDGGKKSSAGAEFRDRMIEVKGRIHSPGVLNVTAAAENGLAADSPFLYEIDTMADRPPSVSWLMPKETVLDAPVEGLLPMRWLVEDDFGISDFRVLIKMSDGAQKQLTIPFLRDRKQTVSYLLEVSNYLSYAGSEIEVRAEALDNDDVSGSKSGLSPAVRVRSPTVMDVYRNLTDRGAEVSRVMERLSGESTRLLKKMTQAARTLKAEGKMAWQMEQELVTMAEAAQQAKRDAEQALSELGRQTQTAARQNLLSRETLQKLSSIGAMMSNLMREEYARAQSELQRALGAVRMDEKERSMMTAKFNLEQFVEQVDRTHRMLSRVSEVLAKAEAQKAMQDLVDRAQKALSDQNPENLQALSREASNLMPKLQELAKDPAFAELKKALTASGADLPKQFDQAARAMRESGASSQESKAAAEKLKKSLNDLQAALQKGTEKSEEKEKENAANKINSVIDALIFSLGEMQASSEYFWSARVQRSAEEYTHRLRKAAALEPILVHAVSDVAATSERLILFDPRPMQWLQRALASIHSLSENDEDPSALSARLKMSYRYAATATLQLLEISQTMQKQGGGKEKGTPMQDLADLLQQLISAQTALNSKTQMSLQLGMFGESLEQLAFQQELIRRSLEAEAGRFSELQDKLGRIDQLLQEMRKTEDELRKLGPTPDVQDRQQKIMNKLMELQQSLTDREEKEEKFEAEPFFGKPADTSVLRLDRPKINEQEFLRGLPPEFREAGKKYLRALLGGDAP